MIPDKMFLKLMYRHRIGKRLNLKNPTTYNEKLQWLKLYDQNPNYTKLADKYEVRKFIADKIGQEYLVPLIGVYNSFDEIDFDSLPNSFVLKCTHDSGGLVICKDRSKLDIEAAKKKIDKSLRRNYYYHGREWPYKYMKPRIICEEYMEDASKKQLIDFKVMCFNGKAKCIFVCQNRSSSDGLNIDIYDRNWRLMDFERPKNPNSGTMMPKPKSFDEMIEYSEKLSRGVPFLRVDFYEVNMKLYFGE